MQSVECARLPYAGIWGRGSNARVAEKPDDPHHMKQETDEDPPIAMAVSALVGVEGRTPFVVDHVQGFQVWGHCQGIRPNLIPRRHRVERALKFDGS